MPVSHLVLTNKSAHTCRACYGVVAFELEIPQKHRAHIALVGGAGFFHGFSVVRGHVLQSLPWGLTFGDVFLDDFWLRFGCPAMGIHVFEDILFLGWFCYASRAMGESVLEV